MAATRRCLSSLPLYLIAPEERDDESPNFFTIEFRESPRHRHLLPGAFFYGFGIPLILIGVLFLGDGALFLGRVGLSGGGGISRFFH